MPNKLSCRSLLRFLLGAACTGSSAASNIEQQPLLKVSQASAAGVSCGTQLSVRAYRVNKHEGVFARTLPSHDLCGLPSHSKCTLYCSSQWRRDAKPFGHHRDLRDAHRLYSQCHSEARNFTHSTPPSVWSLTERCCRAWCLTLAQNKPACCEGRFAAGLLRCSALVSEHRSTQVSSAAKTLDSAYADDRSG